MRTMPLVALLAVGTAALAQLPDRIIIPHDVHHGADVECAVCHAGAAESRTAGESFRPDMEVCAACHDVEDEDGCVMCHTNVDEAGDYPRRVYGAQEFVHAPHVEAGLACGSCHGDPAAVPRPIPGKAECRACHRTADDYADCRVCHADAAPLTPADHAGGWDVRHGAFARADQAACTLCHTETTCQECHAGDNLRPRSHTLDFAFAHAARARGNESECAVCHTEPVFCTSCHAANRVLPRSHSRVGWVRAADGGRHAVEGAFELESCIACHSDGPSAPTCAACHGG